MQLRCNFYNDLDNVVTNWDISKLSINYVQDENEGKLKVREFTTVTYGNIINFSLLLSHDDYPVEFKAGDTINVKLPDELQTPYFNIGSICSFDNSFTYDGFLYMNGKFISIRAIEDVRYYETLFLTGMYIFQK